MKVTANEYFEVCKREALEILDRDGPAEALAHFAHQMAKQEVTRPFMKTILRGALEVSLQEMFARRSVRTFIEELA